MVELVHKDTSLTDIAVELSGVSKTFYQRQRSEKLSEVFRNLLHPTIREIPALREIDLQIRKGEIVAYAGPNGAGKSTTVKLLSSILAPDHGTIRALGMDPVRDRVRYVNRIGVVFGQRTELWWDHPVSTCFEWKRVVWDIPRERYERMSGFVRELLGLDEFFNSLTRELSLGQRMRADLGLALLHEPDLLLLDEPTIGVDVLAKRKLLQFIKDLNQERKVTVMVTSHDMAELEELAGRIVLINQGRLAFDGSFEDLRRQYGDRRVLIIETADTNPPTLTGAKHIQSEENRHEYTFNASEQEITLLLQQASDQTKLLDVQTLRAPIDQLFADIYHRWRE